MQKLQNPYSPAQCANNRAWARDRAARVERRKKIAFYAGELNRMWNMSAYEYRTVSVYVTVSFHEDKIVSGAYTLTGAEYEKWLHHSFRHDYPQEYAEFLRTPEEREAERKTKRAQCKNSLRPAPARTGDVGTHPMQEKQRTVSDDQHEKLEAMFEAERLRQLAEDTAPRSRGTRGKKSELSQAQFDKLTAKRLGGAK